MYNQWIIISFVKIVLILHIVKIVFYVFHVKNVFVLIIHKI